MSATRMNQCVMVVSTFPLAVDIELSRAISMIDLIEVSEEELARGSWRQRGPKMQQSFSPRIVLPF